MLISIFSWFLYLVALKMKAYANMVRFMPVCDMPLAFSQYRGFASKFWLARLAITYGSLGGIWYKHGYLIFAVAFSLYILLCIWSYWHGFKSVVAKWTLIAFEIRMEEAAKRGENIDQSVAWAEANATAERHAQENFKQNGML